jgi:hypothetical protein
MVYSGTLDEQLADGKSRLLAAYSRLALKEETLNLAEGMYTKGYSKYSINSGRRHFLTFLESIAHPCMRNYSIDEILDLYKDPLAHYEELTTLLSTILVGRQTKLVANARAVYIHARCN